MSKRSRPTVLKRGDDVDCGLTNQRSAEENFVTLFTWERMSAP